jgi:DNA-binding winged helix-turn-helix (wHTH) protein
LQSQPEGQQVRLTEKETSILRYLYRAGQRPVSREMLLQEVWGSIFLLVKSISRAARPTN